MAKKEIGKQDQKCISLCIFQHWSEHSRTQPEHRMDEYNACLSNCKVCS